MSRPLSTTGFLVYEIGKQIHIWTEFPLTSADATAGNNFSIYMKENIAHWNYKFI